jgi:hypothetical protein
VAVPVSAVAKPTTIQPAVEPVAEVAAPHPADGTKDHYEYADRLLAQDPSGQKFKAFVDRNPHLEGLGYVENKGKITPAISRPDTTEENPFKGLNVGQAAIMERLIAARLGAGEANDLRRQHLDQLRIANENTLTERREKRLSDIETKKQEDFNKQLNVYAIDKNTGVFNGEKGIFEMTHQGHPIPEAHKVISESVYAPFRSQKAALEKKYKRNLSPTEEKTLKANYFKAKGWAE